MNCPNDQTTLVMSSRSGIEIDYCPQCRGVWLDRGELDKILEREQKEFGNAAQDDRRYQDDRSYLDDRQYREDGHHRGGHHSNNRRGRGGLLGQLFD